MCLTPSSKSNKARLRKIDNVLKEHFGRKLRFDSDSSDSESGESSGDEDEDDEDDDEDDIEDEEDQHVNISYKLAFFSHSCSFISCTRVSNMCSCSRRIA